MTSIASATSPLDVSRLIPLQATKLSDDQIAALRSTMEKGYQRPMGPPDNAPENIYAQVKVGGKVVATLYNSGCAETSNSVGAQLQDQFASQMDTGPKLAQTRAEQIAALVGGTIEKASTAQTPAQWAARPAPTYYTDYPSMTADWPGLSSTRTSQLNTQLIAQFQQTVDAA